MKRGRGMNRHEAMKNRHHNQFHYGIDSANPGARSVAFLEEGQRPRTTPPQLHPELTAQPQKPARTYTLAELYAAAKKERGS